MFCRGNKDLGNSGSAFLNRGALCLLTSSCIKDMMEGSNWMENRKSPQERKFTCFRVAFYTFIFVLTLVSALVSIVFCSLHQKQASGFCWAHGELSSISNSSIMSWDWKLEHCDGFVQDHDQFLIIEQSGNYFVYAQVNRIEETEEPFTLILYKDANITLNRAGGPITGDGMATVNFARPFFLNKGDRLYCMRNVPLDKILPGNESYWGLFKM